MLISSMSNSSVLSIIPARGDRRHEIVVADTTHCRRIPAIHTGQALTLVLDHEQERSLAGEVAGPGTDGVDVVVWIAQLLRMCMRP